MLSRPGEITRTHDPDRFLTALFAPPEARETLFALYAFNHELARAREAAREPVMALMRLQWWREVVEGERRAAHEVAAPLSAALDQGRLLRADLLAMVDGREAEAGEDATLEDWRDYVLATAGGVAVAAARALGASGDGLATARAFGAAYGAGGILRHGGALAAGGRAVLPPGDGDRAGVLAAEGRRWLAEGDAGMQGAARVASPALSAVLVGTLARRDLRRRESGRPRGLADRLAVVAAYARGRP